MAGFLEVAGALGQGVAGTSERVLNLADLISQQKHRDAQRYVEQQKVGLEERRVVADEQTAKIQAAQEARTKEQYEQGQQLLDPDDYFPRMGIRPGVAQMMKDKANMLGFGEKLPTGKLGIRQKNINPAMEAISKDLGFQLQMEESNYAEIETELAQVQEAYQKKPGDPKTEEQMNKLIQEKTKALKNYELLNAELQKQTTIPTIEAAKIRAESASKIEATRQEREERERKFKAEESALDRASREKIAREQIAKAIQIANKASSKSGEKWSFSGLVTEDGSLVMVSPSGESKAVNVETGKLQTMPSVSSHKTTTPVTPTKPKVVLEGKPTAASKVQQQKLEQEKAVMDQILSILGGTE